MPDIGDLHFTLGEVNGKLDMLLQQGKIQDDRAIALEARVRIIEPMMASVPTDIADLKKRARVIENRQHWYAGVAAGAAFFANWAWTYLTSGATAHR